MLGEVKEAGSGLRAGKLVDLSPLERRISELHQSVSKTPLHASLEERGKLEVGMRLIMNGLEYLEELVVAQKDRTSMPATPSPTR